MSRAGLLASAAAALSACAATEQPVLPLFPMPTTSRQAALAPATNFNLVTVRDNPVTSPPPGVLCVSPSPDWLMTLTRTATGTAGVNLPSQASGNLSISTSNTEAAVQALGRTAGVVALRDALYQACQAYANGQIGRSAYALILSQYGNVLSEVVGATPIAGPSAAPPPADAGKSAGSPSNGASPSAAANASPRSAAPPSPAIAKLQQQHIQALVVACLNLYDPSLNHNAPPPDNAVLSRAQCNRLIDGVIGSVPALLQASTTPAGAGAKP